MINLTSPRVKTISSISPSRAKAMLGCRLSEAFRSGNCAPCLPTHPKAHFGILAHDFLRGATSGLYYGLNEMQIRAEWLKSVASYEQALRNKATESPLVPLSRSCDDFEVDVRRLLKVGIALTARYQRKSASDVFPSDWETKLESKDGLIKGRLDQMRWESGSLIIDDFKTGSIYDDSGKLKSALEIQMLLYGYLLHESVGKWPNALRIIPLRGDYINVPFNPNEAEKVAQNLKKQLDETNKEIEQVLACKLDESMMASSSPENCRFCSFRPSCEAYWKTRSRDAAGWPADISGTLSAIKPLGPFYMLELLFSDGSSGIIRGLDETRLTTTRLHQNIRVCNLKRERAVGVYSWRQCRIYMLRKSNRTHILWTVYLESTAAGIWQLSGLKIQIQK